MSVALAEADHGDISEDLIPSIETSRLSLSSDTAHGSEDAEVPERLREERTEETSPLIASRQDDMPDPYARRDVLKQYIPEVDPENDRAMTLSVKVSKRTTMLRIQLAIAILVAGSNIGATIWLPIAYPPNSLGVGTFTYGSCKNASYNNSVLHIALNIVSSLFLGAGNYCMQILAAPSREEIEQAHAKKTSLEIGVLSVKNMWHMSEKGWNSVIFTSLPFAAVPRAVVTNDFLIAGENNWTASDPLGHYQWWKPAPGYGDAALNKSLIYGLQASAVNMTRLDRRACVQRYVNPLTSTSSVIVVARNVSLVQNNNSSLIDGWVSAWESWRVSSEWICRLHQSTDPSKWKYCNAKFAESFADHWSLGQPGAWAVAVDYCLVGEEGNNQERCGLHYSWDILKIVCACAILASFVIFWTWLQIRHDDNHPKGKSYKRTVVTMGDAIHSFLESPSESDMDSTDQKHSTSRMSGFVEIGKMFWKTEHRIPWSKALSGWAWALSVLL
ncbi:MAG: hypothetical protein Q9187_006539 [Circinaria calcarea]